MLACKDHKNWWRKAPFLQKSSKMRWLSRSKRRLLRARGGAKRQSDSAEHGKISHRLSFANIGWKTGNGSKAR
jgi:hypothetical protein